jgi:hypothetical protein
MNFLNSISNKNIILCISIITNSFDQFSVLSIGLEIANELIAPVFLDWIVVRFRLIKELKFSETNFLHRRPNFCIGDLIYFTSTIVPIGRIIFRDNFSIAPFLSFVREEILLHRKYYNLCQIKSNCVGEMNIV